MRARAADSLQTAARVGEGTIVLDVAGQGDVVLSSKFACADCGIALGEITPRLFSFNSPFGACTSCNGLGSRMTVDPSLVVPDASLSIQAGAIRPWRDAKTSWYRLMLRSLAKALDFRLETPWRELPAKVKQAILHGTGEEVELRWEGTRSSGTYQAPFDGVIPSLVRRHRQTENDRVRQQIEEYMRHAACQECGGTRLKPESRAVKIGERGIAELDRPASGRRARLLSRALLRQARAQDRRPDPEGDRRAAHVPGQRRRGLSHVGSQRQHALRRRGPAHPARDPVGIELGRRAVHPGRAVDRAASRAIIRDCWRAS